jgi:Caspase domain
MRLSSDGRVVIQSNKSGRFFVYDVRKGRRLLSGYGLDDETVIYADEGYFAASAEGAHLVSLSFPGVRGLHSFHQFKKVLYRPDLIRSIVTDVDAPVAAPAITTPPAVEIALPKSANQPPRTLEVSARSATGLGLVRIYRDGMLLRELPVAGSRADMAVELDVLPHTRFITAVAVDGAGIESLPQSIELPAARAGTAGRGTLHVLAVGTDRYDDNGLAPLKFAKADARTFVKAASAAGRRSYGSVSAETLLDQADLKVVLIDRIRRIAEHSGAGDTIMLFAAGHGLRDANGRFYLATADTRLTNLAGTAIASDEIAAALEQTRARVVIFLDACHSGAADGLATNDDAVAAFLDCKSSIAVIAASKGRQYSQERAAIGGGLFTKAIEAAVTTNRARVDANKSGTLELSELYGAIKRHVVEATGGSQTPWIARNNMVGEIPLF